MGNDIKRSAGGLALQVTKSARKADLVAEDTDGNATRLADVYVYAFDDALLVLDAKHVSTADRAELVASAARDTASIYQGRVTTLQIQGNGYQVQLPNCKDAGLYKDDNTSVVTMPGGLVIHNGDQDGDQERLAEDLAAIRDEQANKAL